MTRIDFNQNCHMSTKRWMSRHAVRLEIVYPIFTFEAYARFKRSGAYANTQVLRIISSSFLYPRRSLVKKSSIIDHAVFRVPIPGCARGSLLARHPRTRSVRRTFGEDAGTTRLDVKCSETIAQHLTWN
eukprot:356245-Amphidinium_carterae.1